MKPSATPFVVALFATFVLALSFTPVANAQSADTDKVLQALEARIQQLEEKYAQAEQRTAEAERKLAEAQQKYTEAEEMTAGIPPASSEAGGIVQQISEHITVSGSLEFEASSAHSSPDSGDSTTDTDLQLATADLTIEGRLNENLGALVTLSYDDEQDSDDTYSLDEAYILLGGSEEIPYFLRAGKMYLSFAEQTESVFVTDPMTLTLGEIQDDAAVVGYENEWLAVETGGYHSPVLETKSSDSQYISWYAAAKATLPEEMSGGWGLSVGAAYVSNLAASSELQDLTVDNEVKDIVGGLSLSGEASYMGVFLKAEYVTAMDKFKSGDLADIEDGNDVRPSAWNAELGYEFDESVAPLVLAVRAGGTDDIYGSDFLHESEYGGVGTWSFNEYLSLSLEYLHGKFQNDDEDDTVTMQLAVEF